MDVKVNQAEISQALGIVSRAINPNNTLPILNNILIEAKDNKLNFSATNLEIGIKYGILAHTDKNGTITVPAKLVNSYISLLPNEQLSLTVTEDLSFEIKSQKSDTKIKGLKSDDYPTIPNVDDKNYFEVKAKLLEKAIIETEFSASVNTTRPTLSGIFLKFGKDELIMAATDSYRLSESKIEITSSGKEDIECTVPGKTMQELARILALFEKETVKIYIDKNKIRFSVHEMELTSRLIDGNFPDYKTIIPQEFKTKIIINSTDLNIALKRINLFAKELNNAILMDIDVQAKKMTLLTEETSYGEEKTELDIEITGENNKISLNSQYLLDVLSVKEGENIVIEVNEKLSPVKVSPEKNPNYTYIIMPLKV